MDDSYVSKCTPETAMGQNAYILFYEKVFEEEETAKRKDREEREKDREKEGKAVESARKTEDNTKSSEEHPQPVEKSKANSNGPVKPNKAATTHNQP